jgi:hypothetical protein
VNVWWQCCGSCCGSYWGGCIKCSWINTTSQERLLPSQKAFVLSSNWYHLRLLDSPDRSYWFKPGVLDNIWIPDCLKAWLGWVFNRQFHPNDRLKKCDLFGTPSPSVQFVPGVHNYKNHLVTYFSKRECNTRGLLVPLIYFKLEIHQPLSFYTYSF